MKKLSSLKTESVGKRRGLSNPWFREPFIRAKNLKEDYQLRNQITDAVISSMSNIADSRNEMK